VSESIASGRIVNPEFFLNLKVSQAIQVPVNYSINAYPLATSWSMGTGYVHDGNQLADGVNWKYTDGISIPWFVSQSATGCDGGGAWFATSSYIVPTPTPTSTITPTISSSPTSTMTPTPTPTQTQTPTLTPTVVSASYCFSLPGISIGPIDETAHSESLDVSGLPISSSFVYTTIVGTWSTGSVSGSEALNTDGYHVQLFEQVGTASVMVFDVLSPSNPDTFPTNSQVPTLMYWSSSMETSYNGGPLTFTVQTNYGPSSSNAIYNLDNLVVTICESGSILPSPTPTSTQTPTPTPTATPTQTPTPTPSLSGVVLNYLSSESFVYQTSDVKMDVTNIVDAWLLDQIQNNGFIVMHSNEYDNVDYGKLRFFSKETNTIYSPYLEVVWDDSVYNPTASIDTIDLTETVVSIKNMMPTYRRGSVIKFNVTPRYRYPLKTFTNMLSSYLDPYYLPSSSFYSIKDAQSAETVIPYDEGTKISTDPCGNNFYLDMSGLCEERYYKVEIKSEQSGSVVTFDIPTAFKIIR
jgi:hypothetical protein